MSIQEYFLRHHVVAGGEKRAIVRFCGLNGSNMAFRSKSANRSLEELDYLTKRYPDKPVSVVDNILDMRYFKDFIPRLTERATPLELFFEVKANLRKEQVRQLRAAGVTMIQPGIESLSDPILKLMKKGVKAIQNIQLLKWCKEIGMRAEWNILWGFPQEPAEEYERMAHMIPLISHFQPPISASPLRLDRFSPNYDTSEQMGFKNVRPYPSYNYILQLQ